MGLAAGAAGAIIALLVGCVCYSRRRAANARKKAELAAAEEQRSEQEAQDAMDIAQGAAQAEDSAVRRGHSPNRPAGLSLESINMFATPSILAAPVDMADRRKSAFEGERSGGHGEAPPSARNRVAANGVHSARGAEATLKAQRALEAAMGTGQQFHKFGARRGTLHEGVLTSRTSARYDAPPSARRQFGQDGSGTARNRDATLEAQRKLEAALGTGPQFRKFEQSFEDMPGMSQRTSEASAVGAERSRFGRGRRPSHLYSDGEECSGSLTSRPESARPNRGKKGSLGSVEGSVRKKSIAARLAIGITGAGGPDHERSRSLASSASRSKSRSMSVSGANSLLSTLSGMLGFGTTPPPAAEPSYRSTIQSLHSVEEEQETPAEADGGAGVWPDLEAGAQAPRPLMIRGDTLRAGPFGDTLPPTHRLPSPDQVSRISHRSVDGRNSRVTSEERAAASQRRMTILRQQGSQVIAADPRRSGERPPAGPMLETSAPRPGRKASLVSFDLPAEGGLSKERGSNPPNFVRM